MRQRDLIALGFPGVRARVADFAVSAGGAEACRALVPTADPALAEERIEQAWQSFRLFEEHGDPPLAEFADIGASLAAARHEGFVLDGKALVEIRRVLAIARAVGAFLRSHLPDGPSIAGIAARLRACPPLEASLARALDEEGNVVDRASDELARVRATIRQIRDTLTKRLEALVSRSGATDVFADDYVTLRNNRFVVPVRASAASRFQGVVQDRSVSGETLFVEPLFAVELNNRLLMAVREEEAVVRRILADLTALVRSDREPIADNLAALIEIDGLAARARFARTYQCTRPRFTSGTIELRDARHPGLLFTGRPVTPTDIVLPDDQHALVISGPNTGGKTVALKTLGLCALMAQSGILIPAAEGALLPCVSAVFTDIGDEQSIERNLSTFSAHILNLKEILTAPTREDTQRSGRREAGEFTSPADAHRSGAAAHGREIIMTLLDEPGVGTDPDEGAALAIGLIEEFQRRGARLVVTTHYSQVKVFALGHPSCSVAAVEFDVETLTAGYRLVYHSLGSSLALPIARRLGLPESVLAAAEASRSEKSRAFAEALERLEGTRRHLEEERARFRERDAALSAKEAQAQELLERLRERRRKAWETELREAREFLRTLKAEGQAELTALRDAHAERAQFRRFVAEREQAVAARAIDAEDPAPRAESTGPPLPGDTVEVGERKIRGQLLAVEGERAWIQRGSLRFEVPTAELRRIGPGTSVPAVRIHLPEIDEAAAGQLSVIGLRAREALHEVEGFLDQATRARRPQVRIIHGVGSGALRRALHEYLSGSSYCTEFHSAAENDGGAGVTIVRIDG